MTAPPSSTYLSPSPYQQRAFGKLLQKWEATRDTLADATDDAETDGRSEDAASLRRLTRRLDSCCRTALVNERTDTGDAFISEARCRNRFCPRCGMLRRLQLQRDLLRYVQTMHAPRFLTLTQRSTDDPLRDQIRQLTKSFAKLRRTLLWQETTAGGVYTIEVTFNHRTHQWHPHVHAIIEGEYIPQGELADVWQDITGGSRVVDIRACHDRRQLIRYLAQYVAKTCDHSNVPGSRIAEWVLSVRGLRFVSRFGCLHNTIPEEEPEDDAAADARIIGAADHLADAATRGDGEAAELLRLLRLPRTDRVPADPEGPAGEAERAGGSLALRLRAWFRNFEEVHRDDRAPPAAPHRSNRAVDRTERLWEESAPAEYPNGVL